jgi:hypothetical protein
MRALLLLAATAFSVVAASSIETIRIRVPEGYDEVTYDASRVKPEDLKQWLTLSPVLSQNTNYLVPENVSLCIIDDPGYTGCGREQTTLNIANARHGQERIRKRLKALSKAEFPSEFAPIVDYFRAVQSFALWQNQQEIAYFETKDISFLQRRYETIDPKISCAGVLDLIRRIQDQKTARNAVRFQWENCMSEQVRMKLGGYPQEVWNSALSKRGIRERLVVEENE